MKHREGARPTAASVPIMAQSGFGDELNDFRANVRRFVRREIEPHTATWERDGIVPLEVWRALGEAGLLCVDVPASSGGTGADVRFSAVVLEELARANAGGLCTGVMVHSDIVAPYLVHHGTEQQKQRWLPCLISGEVVGAIAMTEPSAGSDLKAIRTEARRSGAGWLISGQKTFISNGQNAGLVITATKTDAGAGARGMSLFLIETSLEGYRRGRNLHKIGQLMADTSELYFEGVPVGPEALLGAEGEGFAILISELSRERTMIAVIAQAAAEAALDWTVSYVRERKAFGKPLAAFQNTRFKLAELRTEIDIGHTFIDHCLGELAARRLDATHAAKAKYWMTELQGRACELGVQLHGGYGYMAEYPIARAWADARVQRIYGGANEIMLEIVARSFLGRAD
jgi:acyl-CoA dehydrogenase